MSVFFCCFFLVSMQTKKNKKKPKPEVKPTKAVSSTDGKEPDEGMKLGNQTVVATSLFQYENCLLVIRLRS